MVIDRVKQQYIDRVKHWHHENDMVQSTLSCDVWKIMQCVDYMIVIRKHGCLVSSARTCASSPELCGKLTRDAKISSRLNFHDDWLMLNRMPYFNGRTYSND